MTTIEQIMLKLGVDKDDAERMMRGFGDTVNKTFGGITSTVKGLAAPIAGLFAADGLRRAAEGAVAFGKAVKAGAEEAATTMDFFQGFTEWVEDVGAEGEKAGAMLTFLSRKMGEARSGSEQAADAFKKIGVSIEGKTTEEVLYDIADAFKSIQDPALKNAYAMDLFGKAGTDIAQHIGGGADAMRKFVEETDKLDNETIERLREIDRRLDSLGDKWKLFWGGLIGGLAGPAPHNFSEDQISKKIGELNAAGKRRKGTPGVPYEQEQINAEMRDMAVAELRKEAEAARIKAAQKKAQEEEDQKAANKRKDSAQKNITEAERIERQNALEQMTTKQRIVELEKEKIRLIKEFANESKNEVERSKALVDLAKVDGDLAKAKKEKKKEEKDFAKEVAKADKERSDTTKEIAEQERRIAFTKMQGAQNAREPYMPTIASLAQSGQWVRGNFSAWKWRWRQGPFAGVAKQIQNLEADAQQSIMFGNTARADADIKRVDYLKGALRKAGVLGPDERAQNMDENMRRMSEALTNLVEKRATIKVEPVMEDEN